jgi:hypothetical protein
MQAEMAARMVFQGTVQGAEQGVSHLARREGDLQVLILGDGSSCASADDRQPHLQSQHPLTQDACDQIPPDVVLMEERQK